MDLIVKNIGFAMKDISNKLIIFGSDRQIRRNSAVWRKKFMTEKIRDYVTGEEGGEVGTLLVSNDKSNVISNKG